MEVHVFFLSFVYICIAVGDPVIKRGGLEMKSQGTACPSGLPELIPVLEAVCVAQYSFLCSALLTIV
jgi:hypothetical protein